MGNERLYTSTFDRLDKSGQDARCNGQRRVRYLWNKISGENDLNEVQTDHAFRDSLQRGSPTLIFPPLIQHLPYLGCRPVRPIWPGQVFIRVAWILAQISATGKL